ncbi:sulfite exporter TauE/SafE family protein [uncultured Bradyrhizobium sp.]|uniref:sulfite exporter TauE/SafE family protein n=1 Tax=uncultured Bradyrhizobium sp. TaxID=199684 RepID=UPI0035C9B4E4
MACVFAAAIVRGYSGFGFSLLAITSLSLVLPPTEVIPPVFMMEVAASISLLPGIWKDIHWRSLGLLGAGCLVGTPVGVRVLASVPAAPMKIVLASAVVVSAGFLWSGYTRKTMPGASETIAMGGISGLLNGAVGIGGPPIVVFFFNSPAGIAIGRASLIAFFIGTDAVALTFLAAEGLVTNEAFHRFVAFVPGLLAGQWIGARNFETANPVAFRRWILVLLMVLALLTGLQGVMAMLRAS